MKPDIPNDYLIRRSNGKPYTKSGLSSNWQRLMRKHTKAGGEHFTFHDLRSVSADGAECRPEHQIDLIRLPQPKPRISASQGPLAAQSGPGLLLLRQPLYAARLVQLSNEASTS